MANVDWAERFAEWIVGTPDGRGEVKAWCPVCEDPGSSQSPSAQLNLDRGVWKCFSSNCHTQAGATFVKLSDFLVEDGKLPAITKAQRTSRSSFGGKKRSDEDATEDLPSDERVTEWNLNLLGLPLAMKYLTEHRGINRETVERYQIGYDGERFTIPIRNRDRELLNVRRYDSRSSAKTKMINWPGHGSGLIWEPESIANDDWVLLCEGEWDALIARQNGLPAVTSTSGAGTFKESYGAVFDGKEVFICYDNDDAGRSGQVKAQRILERHAREVYSVQWAIHWPNAPKGFDITDFLHSESHNFEDFEELRARVKEATHFNRRAADDVPTKGEKVSLEEAVRPDLVGRVSELVCVIAGKQHPPYAAPREFQATCTQDKGNPCAHCPMMGTGQMEREIPADDATLLEVIDARPPVVQEMMRKITGAKCKDRISFEIKQHWTIEELITTDSLDHRTEDTTYNPVSQRVYQVGTYRTPINSTVRIVGSAVANPRDERLVLFGWLLEQTQTNLDRFVMTDEMAEALTVFQPSYPETPMDKLREIATDLAANVSHIYGRPELHIAYDLVWHSLLDFPVFGSRIGKGWLEALVIGDTRTGKSEVATSLIRHYEAGVLKSCEGATFAGLVGGVQQLQNKWTVTWGAIPLNDRRLVVLDEMSGLRDRDVIENMSSIRSSGRAQLTKIVHEETSARTRLLWITNPLDERGVAQRLADQPGYAMNAIKKLVRNPEDLARFDFAMAVSGNEVDSALINTLKPEEVEHRYTSELCAALVMWAWSRRKEDVKWERGVERYAISVAEKLGGRYVADPPFIQVENVRLKLARIAVAIAARLFSSPDGRRLVIKREHVDSAVEFLDLLYRNEAMGYARMSERSIRDRQKAAKRKEEARTYLRNNSESVLAALRNIGEASFVIRDLEVFGLMERDEAKVAVRDLTNMRMVRRLARGNVRMEPTLLELLREFEDEEEV